MKRRPIYTALFLWMICHIHPPAARADQPTSPERARALYDAALKELEASGPARACPMFEEVSSIAPDSVSAWMMLGECRKRQGKLASAFRAYTQATGVARRLGQSARSEKAAQLAASLEPKMAKITLAPSISLRSLPGFGIRLNGRALALESLDTPIPVDQGEQHIEVHADGKKPLELRRQVVTDGTLLSVNINGPMISNPSAHLKATPKKGSMGGQSAAPLKWACPSKSDIPYQVGDEPTLSAVAEKAYCTSKEPSLTKVWSGIYEYNRAAFGKAPRVYSGQILCLPEQFTGVGWYANRCVSEDKTHETSSNGQCGNGIKESTERCDGSDLGGMSCSQLGFDEGKLICRKDCADFEVLGCGPPKEGDHAFDTASADSASSKDKGRAFKGWAAEAALGVAIPLLPSTWTYLHKPLGLLGLGARIKLFGFELAPRLDFLIGAHGTNYNRAEQEQRVLGGGVTLEWSLPFRVGPARVAPGASAGLMYMKRSMIRADFPFEGKEEKQSGLMPVAGLFVRPELKLPKYPRWNVALELGAELMFYDLVDEGTQVNINAKLIGGMGYAF